MEGKFQEVKEFIRNNPGVGIQEVSDTCDVEQGQIRQWLREERLELTKDSPIRFQCESCGTEIRSGRYCDKCKYKAINGMQTLVNADNPKPLPKTKLERDKEKMRYL
jgi:methionyl-tRNA synthetase